MFDVGAQELLLVVVVAILVIGPKDMPVALRTAGRWIGKVRRISNHFRSGIETMIREAEMEEMEKKWQAQNQKVMEEHPAIEMTAANGGGEGLVPKPVPLLENLAEPAAAPEAEPVVAEVRAKPRAKRKKPASAPTKKGGA